MPIRKIARRLATEKLERRDLLHGGEWLVAEGEGTPLPDFSLVDVNPASSRSNQSVSPRDYLEQVSGWYYTHST